MTNSTKQSKTQC